MTIILLFNDSDRDAARRELLQSVHMIRDLEQTAYQVLGEQSMYCRMLTRSLEEYRSNLEFGCENIE